MEFKAIIDAKARNDAGCAVVGVYEEGDLGIAAGQIDKQLDGLIGKLHGNGDLSGKLGEVMLLPTPAELPNQRKATVFTTTCWTTSMNSMLVRVPAEAFCFVS